MDKSGVQRKNQDSDNRIAKRHVFENRIKISTQLRKENIVIQGWARDMSESGLGAFVAEELLLGEFVVLEILLSASTDTVIPAKVDPVPTAANNEIRAIPKRIRRSTPRATRILVGTHNSIGIRL